MFVDINETEPPTYKLTLTADDLETVRAAFTDRVVREIAEIEDINDDDVEAKVENISDGDIDLSLVDQGVLDEVSQGDLQIIRATLLEFGRRTAQVVHE